MSAGINLLPWRAARRRRRARAFGLQMLAALACALASLLAAHAWTAARVARQAARNAYLQAQVEALDRRLAALAALEPWRRALAARALAIEHLHEQRAQMLQRFAALARTVPDGVRLRALRQRGDALDLEGVARANADVADYLRRLRASPWMGPAQLRGSGEAGGDALLPLGFALDVNLRRPHAGMGAP